MIKITDKTLMREADHTWTTPVADMTVREAYHSAELYNLKHAYEQQFETYRKFKAYLRKLQSNTLEPDRLITPKSLIVPLFPKACYGAYYRYAGWPVYRFYWYGGDSDFVWVLKQVGAGGIVVNALEALRRKYGNDVGADDQRRELWRIFSPKAFVELLQTYRDNW